MAKPSPGTDPVDHALTAMNEHLARFFHHADSLMREWQAQGDQLRQSMDAQVRDLGQTVSDAVGEAGRSAAQRLDSQIEQQVAGGLASLRRELDSLARLADHTATRLGRSDGQGGGTSAHTARAAQRNRPSSPFTSPVLWAVIVANLMLAVLIGMSARSCAVGDSDPAQLGGATPGPTPAGVDAGSDPRPGAEHAAMCATLAQEYDGVAAGAVLSSALHRTCGDELAPAVFDTLRAQLPGGQTAPGTGPAPGGDSGGDGNGDGDGDGDSKAKGDGDKAAPAGDKAGGSATRKKPAAKPAKKRSGS
ncbi:MAG: hypothetical protein AAGC55_05925, partial [Myxococcota bacterium]